MTKPPYRVPLVSEIPEPGPDAPTVVSTFSGAGGSCLGFRYAGFRTLYASEFMEAARDTYRANHPGVYVDDRDIREVTADEILDQVGFEPGELDVLEGSPPCAAFSTAGKRSAKWGTVNAYSDTAQRSDDLFFEYVRLVDGLRPRVFVAENVSGLVKGVAKGYFLEILAAMRALGYRVGARVLDAQWLGVPQRRQRVIFIGVRDDLGKEPAYPSPLPYRYSLRDALPHLSGYRYSNGGFYDSPGDLDADGAGTIALSGGAAPLHHQVSGPAMEWDSGGGQFGRVEIGPDEPSLTITTDHPKPFRVVGGTGPGFSEETFLPEDVCPPVTAQLQGRAGIKVLDGPSLEGYAIGAEYDRIRPGGHSDKYLNLKRPDPEEPSPTVTQLGGDHTGVASVVHPTEKRKFTIAELRRVCGFPDDFVLTGSYAQQWERCGRAVPPPMMFWVALTIRREIL
jgi:DNA (cytosine-5)-methyltransferase 1